MGIRRKARELAVQTLYALDFAEVNGDYREYDLLNKYVEILDQLAETEKLEEGSQVLAFADDLVKNTVINLAEIEAEISKHSENWRLEHMALLDRNIMQIAVYELLFTPTPPRVVINEAIEIAKKFCSESSGKFLNGVLDAINKEIKDRVLTEGI